MANKSKYRLLEVLRSLEAAGETELTATVIAAAADLSRAVTSHYLSALYAEHLVTKHGTKPVYWQSQVSRDPFKEIIGAEGALKNVIADCRGAVTYPPKGFPLIITGSSGVGKSYLAGVIYQYAKETAAISEDAPFVLLNCADYANNPELFASILFGYQKGAFTGAIEDHTGLAEKADGGYLFLDEIHCLPKENQEKFFTLLDEGIFTPLGSNQSRKVSLRFIFATTEPLNTALLTTFRRRVPLVVNLPEYLERPLGERYALVHRAFWREGKKMERDLLIGTDLVKQLVTEPMQGNIGGLHNRIQLLCARGLTKQNENPLHLGAGNEKLLIRWNEPFLAAWTGETKGERLSLVLQELQNSLDLEEKYSEQQFLLKKWLKKLDQPENSHLQEEVYEKAIISEFQKVKLKYGIGQRFSADVFKKLAHLLAGTEGLDLGKETEDFCRRVERQYPRTSYLLEQLLPNLGEDFDAAGKVVAALGVFLLDEKEVDHFESVALTCLLITHGRSTATSMQEVVNTLCDQFIFEAFDMSLTQSMLDISVLLKKYIQRISKRQGGIILLFDMGSLSQMYKEIKGFTETDLLVMNNVTTALALDVALQVQQQKSFKEIAGRTEGYKNLINVQYFEGLSQNRNIIISCMSGVGLSEDIKKIMAANLSEPREMITMEYKELKRVLAVHQSDYFEKTDFIITTNTFQGNYGLPIINIYHLLEDTSSKEFEDLLMRGGENEASIRGVMDGFLEFFSMEGISGRLQFLNPKIVLDEVSGVLKKYEDFFDIHLDGQLRLNLNMHIALMIERMIISSRNHMYTPITETDLPEEKEEFFSISKNIFHQVEVKFNIVVDDYEISLIYELLKPYLI